ncbi:MAG: CapA family protein [Actinomycetota bacterium]
MKLALAGDTMLGRGVAESLTAPDRPSLFAPAVIEIAREADLFVLNLECCISDRGEPWPDPRKPFFFRAPPVAVEVLKELGVDCVTLANNHALDFGFDALSDTFEHLLAAGIQWVGAGPDIERARAPVVLEAQGTRVAVIGASDHPSDFAAAADRPGVALAELGSQVSPWLLEHIRTHERDVVLVTPHWGPNMTPEPVGPVRAAAEALLRAGAGLIAGHSAHVFHGVSPPVLFDLGDFVDDYAIDPVLRNDLGLLFIVTIEGDRPTRVEAIPLALDYCYTRLATDQEAEWIRDRFVSACKTLDTEATIEGDRLVVELDRGGRGTA